MDAEQVLAGLQKSAAVHAHCVVEEEEHSSQLREPPRRIPMMQPRGVSTGVKPCT